jgi:hypothetical protein
MRDHAYAALVDRFGAWVSIHANNVDDGITCPPECPMPAHKEKTMSILCTNPRHDHTTTVDRDGMDVEPPIPMRCNHCGVPTHYDETIEDYQHDRVSDDCFLVQARDNASPCVEPVPLYPDVKVKLTGREGNVFAIIGTVSRALRVRVGMDAEAQFTRDAFNAATYDDVLRLVMRTVDVS